MQIYLKEKIGNPELFTGRKKELKYFLKWIKNIKEERSKSSAILSRRKTGKSALMQRLYNITFERNDQVVPFYYEIKESSQWILSFSLDFLLNFIYQYIAFKSRKREYIEESEKTLNNATLIAKKEGLVYLTGIINAALEYKREENIDMLWDIARDAPRRVAQYNDERVVQMIDEFQLINLYIYRDRECIHPIKNLAGSYLHTIEYRNAPLLVSGSFVGWLIHDLNKMLPGRVRQKDLKDMPTDEAVEMILKYSHIFQEPITYKTALLMADLTEGNPFYISELFDSDFEGRDFTTEQGLINTLEYETTNKRGNILSTWMEYVHLTLDRVNDVNGKNIVLYLSKHRDREVSRKELLENLDLNMTDRDLEKKLHALAYGDIIEYGRSNFYYRGVQDNIFDKVFRTVYQDDIQEFDPADITKEYKEMLENLKKSYKKLSGEYNYYKGLFAEFVIINHLKYRAYKDSDYFKSMMENLPKDFKFEKYKSVWSYKAAPLHKSDIQIDIFANAESGGYSLIGEVKNRKDRKFSKDEAIEFEKKAKELIKLEKIEKPALFVFSLAGFTREAVNYMKENSIAQAVDERWVK